MKFRFPLFAPEGDGAGAGAGGGAGGSGAGAGAGGTLLAGASSGSSQQQADPGAGAGAGAGWTWANEAGTFSDGWADKLPDGLKGNASLRTISSVPDLAKAFVETKGLVGKRMEMPGEGAKPEDIAAFRKVTGAPEKPEGYRGDAKDLKPEGLPDEMWNAEAENKFLAIAHKHHLAPAAVKEILGFYGSSLLDTVKGSQADEVAVLAAEEGKLRSSWGKDFDSNLAVAAQMAKTLGLDPTTDPIFTNARAVEAFAKMAKLVSGDKLVTGEQPSLTTSVRSRAQDIVDPKSQSVLAREYRGEFGTDRQLAAQQQYHQLLAAADASK